MAGEQLAEYLRSLEATPGASSDLTFGIVESLSPLTVLIEGRLRLDSDFVTMSEFLKGRYVTIQGERVEVLKPLQTGEAVRLLRYSNGQRYYIIDRV